MVHDQGFEGRHVGCDGCPVFADNSECLARIGAVSCCECGFENCVVSVIGSGVIVLLF